MLVSVAIIYNFKAEYIVKLFKKNKKIAERYIYILLAGLIVFVPVKIFAQDAFIEFTNAKNSFDAGQYEQAASRFEKLENKNLNNQALTTEVHKYLAVSYLFLDKKKEAEEQFVLLLNGNPGFDLDPLVFPIDAVDFFTEIKLRYAQKLTKISEAKKQAEIEKLKEKERKKQAEIEKLKTTVYLQKEVKRNSKLVAFMPFGAGQFQNEHTKKGIIFLTVQLTLSASSIVTFALHESLKKDGKEPFYSEKSLKDYEKLEKGYRIANQISLISLGTMMMWGIIDSLYYFNPYTVSWKYVDKSLVPAKYKKIKKDKISLKSIYPYAVNKGIGIAVTGSL